MVQGSLVIGLLEYFAPFNLTCSQAGATKVGTSQMDHDLFQSHIICRKHCDDCYLVEIFGNTTHNKKLRWTLPKLGGEGVDTAAPM